MTWDNDPGHVTVTWTEFYQELAYEQPSAAHKLLVLPFASRHRYSRRLPLVLLACVVFVAIVCIRPDTQTLQLEQYSTIERRAIANAYMYMYYVLYVSTSYLASFPGFEATSY